MRISKADGRIMLSARETETWMTDHEEPRSLEFRLQLSTLAMEMLEKAPAHEHIEIHAAPYKKGGRTLRLAKVSR